MTAQQYDAWYGTPRGAWSGETEYRLLCRLLAPAPGASIVDVGCGTGYFTRRFTRDGYSVTGVDLDASMLKSHAPSARPVARPDLVLEARSDGKSANTSPQGTRRAPELGRLDDC